MAHILKYRSGKKANNYLDDFFFARFLLALCNQQVQMFLDICEKIRFPVSLEKTFWGSQVIVFLGILINTVTQTISIPIEKRNKALTLIQDIIMSKKTTVLQLQKITGLLNFIGKAIYPGRAFTRRLYAKFSNPKLKQHYHVKVDDEIRGDLSVWQSFLQDDSAVCRPFLKKF